MKYKYLIGIDEAGRGPLAGPVSVGVACVSEAFSWRKLPGVNDSKILSEKKREEIFAKAEVLKAEKHLHYAVALVSAASIDRIGIVPSIRKAMEIALAEVIAEIACEPSLCTVKLDGSLKAPSAFTDQETIIGGDGKEKIIGLASVLAKVTRDRHMVQLARTPDCIHYKFDTHKGYATKQHRELIRVNGLSSIHRKSYCTRLIKERKMV